MHKSKLSISLPYELLLFIEHRQQSCNSSRSSVIQEALELLKEKELCAAYKAANAEIDNEWDICLLDGLDEER